MTSYVTREEYDRLVERLHALEQATGASAHDNVKTLVQQAVREAMRDFLKRQAHGEALNSRY